MTGVHGAVIEQGASDWQVYQQDDDRAADIAVSGRWGGFPSGVVELRLVREEDSVPVAAHLDWQQADTAADGTWSAVLKRVPSGGLYRLETHLRADTAGAVEWQPRGDIRHFLGVGDLWVIAGQSNSAGYGRGACYDPPELGVHIFNNAMQWALASQPLNASTDTAHPENREGGNSGHGPWLHFARLVRQRMHIPVGLLQVSLGGSPLSLWNPTEPGEHPLYDLMVRVCRAAGGKVRGVLWYQGESDADEKQASTYEERFIAAVKAWGQALGRADLPVLTVQISHWAGTGKVDPAADRGWSLLREAQRRVALRLPNVSVASSLDLPLTDGIHIAPYGNMLLAQRIADAALATVYGQNVRYLAPQPASIRVAREGRALEIEFENVAGRIDSIDPWARPFRVEDDDGVVEVLQIEYTGTAVIRLCLGRALSGRAVVHGAYGHQPATAPMDMDRVVPMLGFYGFPVSAQ